MRRAEGREVATILEEGSSEGVGGVLLPAFEQRALVGAVPLRTTQRHSTRSAFAVRAAAAAVEFVSATAVGAALALVREVLPARAVEAAAVRSAFGLLHIGVHHAKEARSARHARKGGEGAANSQQMHEATVDALPNRRAVANHAQRIPLGKREVRHIGAGHLNRTAPPLALGAVKHVHVPQPFLTDPRTRPILERSGAGAKLFADRRGGGTTCERDSEAIETLARAAHVANIAEAATAVVVVALTLRELAQRRATKKHELVHHVLEQGAQRLQHNARSGAVSGVAVGSGEAAERGGARGGVITAFNLVTAYVFPFFRLAARDVVATAVAVAISTAIAVLTGSNRMLLDGTDGVYLFQK